MIAQRNTLFRIVCKVALPGILYGGIIVTQTPDDLLAVTETPQDINPLQPAADERDQRPHRIPPQVARDACQGKNEGDPCSFTADHESMNGDCLSGVENIFACRPHHGASPPKAPVYHPPQPTKESVPDTSPVHQTERRSVPQPETGSLPVARDMTGTHTENPPPHPEPIASAGIMGRYGNYAATFVASLATALLAAGATWYGFFRHSTLPLRRLRTVTQQLAGGNLSARIGEGLVHRKDEVADLGRDVDRMAQRIESLVGAHQRLIRDVSHELRSPLARLNVALELARQSAGPTLSAPFDRIERESDRLNELIGQLLMLTKLESESVTRRTELDIADLVAEVAQDVDFEARSSDRRVVMTGCEPLLLNGNRELLHQALENLVRNAARYTAEGTTVEISLCRKETKGIGMARIEVRDHGPGVPESELGDIFRPFYRVNDARDRQSGGAGVGLAISDRAVSLHGGSLRASNAPTGGLIMEMELPVM